MVAAFRRILGSKRSRAGLLGAFLVVEIAVVCGTAGVSDASDSEKGMLGSLLSKTLSTPASQVSIGDVEGVLSSEVSVRDIVISDSEGPWLKLDSAKLVWSRLALLIGRVEIDSLEVGKLEILRKPLPDTATAPAKPEAEAASDGKLLPELPVKIQLKSLKLGELALGETIIGQAARLTAEGSAKLGNPSEGLELRLDAKRLDGDARVGVQLSFVPEGEKLAIKATLTEAQGGLVATAAGLPGTPPVRLDIDGSGSLDSWAGKLDFEAGPEIGAKGNARIVRNETQRKLGLDLGARIAGLVPGPAAIALAGTTRLQGDVGFADGGAIRIERVELASQTARLGIAGTIGADKVADLTVQARAIPNEGGVTRAAGSEIESLVLDASLKGPLTAPKLAGTFKAAGLRSREANFHRVEATIGVDPSGSDPATAQFALSADAKVDGLSLGDRALTRAIGGKSVLALRATAHPDGVVDVQSFALETDSIKASYAGKLGQSAVAGLLEAKLTDLGAFSDLAGRELGGRAAVKVRLAGNPAAKDVSAALELRGEGLALGHHAADSLLGPAPLLTGKAAQAGDGFVFDGLRLEGAGLTATVQGKADAASADVLAKVDLKTLAALDGRLKGKAQAEARLTGSLAKPNVTATITAPEASASGKPIRALRVDANVKDLTGALDGTVKLSGDVAGKPLSGDVHVAKTNGPGGLAWTLDKLVLALGSVSLDGRATVDAKSLLGEGRIALRAGNLDDVSPLALAPMAGSLDVSIDLAHPNGGQDATIKASGSGIRYAEYGLAKLDADLKGQDLLAKPKLDGRLHADRITASGQVIDSVRLNAAGTPEASDVTLTAQARGFALDGAARLAMAEQRRVELQRFNVARGSDKLALTGPATITLEDGAVLIEDLAIAIGGGRVSVDGRAGSLLDLKVAIRALPLSIARLAAPDLALSGTLDGEADLRGSATSPEGKYALTVSKLVTPETRKAGLPPIDVRANGSVHDGRAGLDARIVAGKGADVTVTGSLPVDGKGALDIAARGKLDSSLANSMLSAGGQRVTGSVGLDARVGGTVAAPKVEGAATLNGMSVTDPLNGLSVTDIQGRITGRGDSIVIERITASTDKKGGRLSIEGKVAVDPAAGFPGTIKLTADRAQLVSSPLIEAISSLNLTMSGPLARSPKITGRVDVVSVEVQVPNKLPTSAKPLDGIRRVNTSPAVRARLAQRDQKKNQAAAAINKKGGKTAAPFDATLDLVVSAPNRIFVRGRGIDAELGGELKIVGNLGAPRATGDFELRRGRFALAGTRLDFTRGRVDFAGDLTTPMLDFMAETKAGEVTARIGISGPASQPVMSLTSDPTLAQDEVLSRLLFQKASGGLSPFQALQLAQAVAELSGYSSGPGALDTARKGLGLDNLDVSTGSTGGPTVGGQKYINDKLSVGVKAGAKPADTAATVGYDITRRIKIQGEAGSDGRTAVGVGAEWEWK